MRYVSNVYNLSVTPFVKGLVITNVVIWFFLVVVLQGLFLEVPFVFHFLGLTPERVFSQFWLWQIVTYMFVHSSGVFHLLFNMFVLWMFGAELERFWGSKFFLIYYLFCGIGAGLIYLLSLWLSIFVFHFDVNLLKMPMIGASGAIFGLLFAYGLIYSDRIIYFMMIFPIKAKYFTVLIAFIEFVSLINSGLGSPVSHLAHLAGIVSGFLILQIWKLVQNFNISKWRPKAFVQLFQNFNISKWRSRDSVHLKILKNDDKEDKIIH